MTIKFDREVNVKIKDLHQGDVFRTEVFCIWMICADTPNQGIGRKTAVNVLTGVINYFDNDLIIDRVDAELIVR